MKKYICCTIYALIRTSAQFTNVSWCPCPVPQPSRSQPQLLPARYHHCTTHRLQVKLTGSCNLILYIPVLRIFVNFVPPPSRCRSSPCNFPMGSPVVFVSEKSPIRNSKDPLCEVVRWIVTSIVSPFLYVFAIIPFEYLPPSLWGCTVKSAGSPHTPHAPKWCVCKTRRNCEKEKWNRK